MKVLWHNIIALILAILAIGILLNMSKPLAAFITGMGDIGPYHATEDKVLGLIAFSLTGLILVAIVKILTHNRNDR